MKANTPKTNKRKIINNYIELRNAAFEEVSVDMVRQTVCILLGALMIEGSYTDEQLVQMYDKFVRFINTPEIMGRPICSDEITDYVVKRLGLDLSRINPKVGD
jgi:hypothetical protein